MHRYRDKKIRVCDKNSIPYGFPFRRQRVKMNLKLLLQFIPGERPALEPSQQDDKELKTRNSRFSRRREMREFYLKRFLSITVGNCIRILYQDTTRVKMGWGWGGARCLFFDQISLPQTLIFYSIYFRHQHFLDIKKID